MFKKNRNLSSVFYYSQTKYLSLVSDNYVCIDDLLNRWYFTTSSLNFSSSSIIFYILSLIPDCTASERFQVPHRVPYSRVTTSRTTFMGASNSVYHLLKSKRTSAHHLVCCVFSFKSVCLILKLQCCKRCNEFSNFNNNIKLNDHTNI